MKINENKKKILLTILITVFAAAYSYAVFHAGAQYYRKTAATQSKGADGYYIVREYNGVIAVFELYVDMPQRVLSIDVSTLRTRDLERFRQGVTVNSLTELMELEEDFMN